jgi:phage gpG-like protein
MEFQASRIEAAATKAAFENIGHAAASLRKDAIASIIQAEGASAPGTPPHTHTGGLTKKGKVRRGKLQRAITFDVDKAKESAVIGPRESVVGASAAAHEFGGSYKGQSYPERPFMGPALTRAESRFAASFAGSIGA